MRRKYVSYFCLGETKPSNVNNQQKSFKFMILNRALSIHVPDMSHQRAVFFLCCDFILNFRDFFIHLAGIHPHFNSSVVLELIISVAFLVITILIAGLLTTQHCCNFSDMTFDILLRVKYF